MIKRVSNCFTEKPITKMVTTQRVTKPSVNLPCTEVQVYAPTNLSCSSGIASSPFRPLHLALEGEAAMDERSKASVTLVPPFQIWGTKDSERTHPATCLGRLLWPCNRYTDRQFGANLTTEKRKHVTKSPCVTLINHVCM